MSGRCVDKEVRKALLRDRHKEKVTDGNLSRGAEPITLSASDLAAPQGETLNNQEESSSHRRERDYDDLAPDNMVAKRLKISGVETPVRVFSSQDHGDCF